MIQCNKCYALQPHTDCQYIGQTGRTIRERFGEHRRDITNQLTDKSGVAEHFNRQNHSLTDISIIPLEPSETNEKVYDGQGNNNYIIAAKTLNLTE